MSPPPDPSSPCPSGSTVRSPPNRAPAKRYAPFLEPSNYLLKFPVNRLHRFLKGPLQRETPISRFIFYTPPSKSLVNEHPSMFPNRTPMEIETSVSRANGLFLHLYLSESPVRSSPTKKTGQTFGHHPHSPMWTEGLHTMECSLVPQVDRFWHCNLYPSAMQPSAWYLPPWLG